MSSASPTDIPPRYSFAGGEGHSSDEPPPPYSASQTNDTTSQSGHANATSQGTASVVTRRDNCRHELDDGTQVYADRADRLKARAKADRRAVLEAIRRSELRGSRTNLSPQPSPHYSAERAILEARMRANRRANLEATEEDPSGLGRGISPQEVIHSAETRAELAVRMKADRKATIAAMSRKTHVERASRARRKAHLDVDVDEDGANGLGAERSRSASSATSASSARSFFRGLGRRRRHNVHDHVDLGVAAPADDEGIFVASSSSSHVASAGVGS